VTPDERAELVVRWFSSSIEQYADPKTQEADKADLKAKIALEIEAAEKVMSKYWDMTVGQERDELRERVSMLEKALCAWNDDFKSSDKNVIAVPRHQIENLLQGRPHNEGH
jgi:hypothetical protein